MSAQPNSPAQPTPTPVPMPTPVPSLPPAPSHDTPPRDPELAAAIEQRQELKRQNAALAQRLDELEKREQTRAAAEESAKKKAADDDLARQGKYEELLAKQKGDYEKTIGDQRLKFTAAYEANVIDKTIKAAAAGVKNIAPTAIDDIPSLLRHRIRLDPDTWALAVMSPDGKPMLGDDMRPLSIDALVAEFVKSKPHLLLTTTPAGPGAALSADGKLLAHLIPADFGEVLKDAELMAKWKAQDEVGFEKAKLAYFQKRIREQTSAGVR